ncbi:putative Anthocyanin 5-aromatic acyltransferase [Melia azedarach]|uniref:Anthocyanin 5-aromatic acyltransferase n=1 Tax=Melia azedarach TaxID=155640 RepID=A0ACC1Z2H1_MELAZ|nr:putative Anthocyanin 5-aromatic acyltransferase [Melia azedarach]
MAGQYTVRVVDESHVAPPPGSVSTTTIPLTFLDVSWIFCCPIQRIFFYEFHRPTLHFTQNIFPHLKQSLSLTLRHFFPFAANLSCSPPPNNPCILYREGDSVSVTIAESDADFNHLTASHARDNTEFKCLVPTLPMASFSSDTTHVVPIMAMQFTVFPNSGISIGITFNHVAADGKSFNHFMKSWAAMHRSEKGSSLSLPFHNKDMIKDPEGLVSTYMKDWWNWKILGATEEVPVDTVRITNDADQPGAAQLHISTFVVTCAFMWVNLIKLQDSSKSNGHLHDDTVYHFVPVADCRDRFEFPVPATYFGNCLAFLFLTAKRSDLIGKNGIVFAAKAIGRQICELEKGPLVGAEKWVLNLIKVVEAGRVVSVAGSPKLRVYDTDFGWGRPKKSEVVHIGANGAFSLAECRDEDGAIEVGIVIGRDKIDGFNVIFKQALNLNF